MLPVVSLTFDYEDPLHVAKAGPAPRVNLVISGGAADRFSDLRRGARRNTGLSTKAGWCIAIGAHDVSLSR